MDLFKAVSPLLFRQIEMFNILVSESRLRHREMHNKDKIVREFCKGDILVVRKQVKSNRKYRITKKNSIKKKGTLRSPRKCYT